LPEIRGLGPRPSLERGGARGVRVHSEGDVASFNVLAPLRDAEHDVVAPPRLLPIQVASVNLFERRCLLLRRLAPWVGGAAPRRRTSSRGQSSGTDARPPPRARGIFMWQARMAASMSACERTLASSATSSGSWSARAYILPFP
jgi:hypothetical protein